MDEQGSLQLMLAGDLMLGRKVNEMLHQAGPAYPMEPLVPITRKADLFFVNLECAISPKPLIFSGPPKVFYFRADPLAAETLTSAGIDLVSLANNHALDADYQGLIDTLAILNERQIAYAGAGNNLEEASRPVLLAGRDLTLGVLAYCDHQGDFVAQAQRPGIRYVNLPDPETPIEIVREVRDLAEQVDHVIVAFHWLPNWVPVVPKVYRQLARALIQAGASVVWGHSPHHILGVEWIDHGVVLYSSGDLVDDYALEPNFRNDRQLLFQLTLGREGVDRVQAYPIELAYARTSPAGDEARQWIEERFGRACAEVGSRAKPTDQWIEVLRR